MPGLKKSDESPACVTAQIHLKNRRLGDNSASAEERHRIVIVTLSLLFSKALKKIISIKVLIRNEDGCDLY